MNKEPNTAKARWDFAIKRLPSLNMAVDMKRANSFAYDCTSLETITVFFNFNELYANENNFFYEPSAHSLCVSLADDFLNRRISNSRSLPICLTGSFKFSKTDYFIIVFNIFNIQDYTMIYRKFRWQKF